MRLPRFDDRRHTIGADPPQSLPVGVIVVDEQRHGGELPRPIVARRATGEEEKSLRHVSAFTDSSDTCKTLNRLNPPQSAHARPAGNRGGRSHVDSAAWVGL